MDITEERPSSGAIRSRRYRDRRNEYIAALEAYKSNGDQLTAEYQTLIQQDKQTHLDLLIKFIKYAEAVGGFDGINAESRAFIESAVESRDVEALSEITDWLVKSRAPAQASPQAEPRAFRQFAIEDAFPQDTRRISGLDEAFRRAGLI